MNKTIILSILASTAVLAEQPMDIGNITVTGASKSEQTLKKVTSNIEVITAEDIEQRHYVTLTDAIASLSGVSFAQNGGIGSVTSVYVQGMDSKYTLVLVDGVKYNEAGSGDASARFEHLMLSDVERIELIKGANPIWGADAAAGVINIVTKRAAKGLKTDAEIMYGSYNTKSANTSIRYGGEKYSIAGGVSRYLTDGFSAQAPRGTKGDDYERDGYQNTSAILKADYQLAKNLKIDGELYSVKGTANYDGYNAPNATQRSAYEYVMKKTAISYDTDKNKVNLQVSTADTKRDELDTTSGVKIFRSGVKNYELKDDYKYAWFGDLTFGTSQEYSDIRYTSLGSSEVKTNDGTRSLFAANTVSHMGLTLTQAIRYDDYTTFGSKTNAKAGVKYSMDNGISISSNYGTAFKAPTILQMANPWGTSNFDLKPEHIRSFDASLSYKNASLTYFFNSVTNLIGWSGGGYANVDGKSKLQGYEAKYDSWLSKALSANIAYTRLHAVDGSNKELAKRPHDTVHCSVDWYPTNNLHIGTTATYIGTRYDTNTKASQTGGYTLIDAVVDYRLNKILSMYGKFENLLDKYYQTTEGYATAGRSLYVGLKAAF